MNKIRFLAVSFIILRCFPQKLTLAQRSSAKIVLHKYVCAFQVLRTAQNCLFLKKILKVNNNWPFSGTRPSNAMDSSDRAALLFKLPFENAVYNLSS